jgi:threonine dehydrogenase-like Zn-dependent dehydrogenase
MYAAMYHGAGDIRWEERPDPRIELPTDVVVRVVASCVCGSDLWGWRGKRPPSAGARPIGHEFVGIVEQLGSGVTTLSEGDFVISPFTISDNTCVNCRLGITTS